MIIETNSRWKHVKRGSTYRVLHEARLQTNAPTTTLIADMQWMVVYQSETDKSVWVRTRAEFTDGRFEKL